MAEAVLGLGGNLGARRAIFDAALTLLAAEPGCTLLARSALYETPPLGPPQPDYLNAAVRVHWAFGMEALYRHTQRIETLLGRARRERWGARTLDIDVLHWSEGPVRTDLLEVPHRELGTRNFALAPLLDVAPELAAQWQPVLEQLGGAPALAQPGWPALEREGAYLCGSWQRDEAELGSQLAALLGRALEWSAADVRGQDGQPGEPSVQAEVAASPARAQPAAAWSTHAFSGPGELFDGDGRSWLDDVVRAAFARGFAVHAAAVTERDEARTAGLLVGIVDAAFRVAARVVPPLELELETRGAYERRLRVRCDAPEHGFDFDRSGTM